STNVSWAESGRNLRLNACSEATSANNRTTPMASGMSMPRRWLKLRDRFFCSGCDAATAILVARSVQVRARAIIFGNFRAKRGIPIESKRSVGDGETTAFTAVVEVGIPHFVSGCEQL